MNAMKKLTIVGLLAATLVIFGQETPTAEEPAPVIATNKIATLPSVMATLKWQLATNWVDSGILVSNANTPGDQRMIENGMISSNLVAWILWKGKTNGVVIESIGVSQIQRTYKLQQTKVYQP